MHAMRDYTAVMGFKLSGEARLGNPLITRSSRSSGIIEGNKEDMGKLSLEKSRIKST